MWIYILVGVLCSLSAALAMWLMTKLLVEGAIIIEYGDVQLQLNNAPELLTEHQYVTFMVVSRK